MKPGGDDDKLDNMFDDIDESTNLSTSHYSSNEFLDNIANRFKNLLYLPNSSGR
jgi:hypothetical protein